jgi:hypothetical protein
MRINRPKEVSGGRAAPAVMLALVLAAGVVGVASAARAVCMLVPRILALPTPYGLGVCAASNHFVAVGAHQRASSHGRGMCISAGRKAGGEAAYMQ